jgi:hypothetical protein
LGGEKSFEVDLVVKCAIELHVRTRDADVEKAQPAVEPFLHPEQPAALGKRSLTESATEAAQRF